MAAIRSLVSNYMSDLPIAMTRYIRFVRMSESLGRVRPMPEAAMAITIKCCRMVSMLSIAIRCTIYTSLAIPS